MIVSIVTYVVKVKVHSQSLEHPTVSHQWSVQVSELIVLQRPAASQPSPRMIDDDQLLPIMTNYAGLVMTSDDQQ